jgi:Lysyl oxidase
MTRRRLLIALLAASLAAPAAFVSPAAAGAIVLLPDLRMAQPYSLQVTTTETGRKKLRFGTIAYNVGDGPIEVRAGDRDGREMNRVRQWIYRSDGTGRAILKPDARVFYAGDGHDHWHVARFIVVHLTPKAGTSANQRRIRKIGFCLLDSVAMPEAQRPPNSSSNPAYFNCGTSQNTKIRVGISVGFGDNYPPEFAFQAVDVTGLPAGDYRLCATVNPRGIWTEKNNNFSNNSFWMDLHLNAATGAVTVLARDDTSCG